MALKARAREVEEDEIEELEDDSDTEIDPAGDEGEEVEEEEEEQEDEKPRKVLKKAKVEKVKPKRRVVQEDDDEEEEEEAPKKVKATASKSGKKVLKMKKPAGKKKAVVHRWARHGWKIPYDKDSMVGKVFLKALEGAKVITLKKMVADLRQSKKGGSWVLSDLRKGSFNGATWTWNEKNGFVRITNLKMAA